MESLRKNIESKWKYLTAQEAMRRAPVLTMSRLFSWRARCLLRCAAIARLPRWDVQMFLPANWRGVEKLIFAFREYYEPELDYLKQILSPGMTFVDVELEAATDAGRPVCSGRALLIIRGGGA